MDYWGTFTKTLKQWWNHKYLWILGILATILAGSGGSSGYSSNYSTGGSSRGGSSSSTSDFDTSVIADFFRDPANVTIVLVIVGVLCLVGFIFFCISLYLKARSDSALFQATEKISQDDQKIGFWKTWGLGKLRLGTLIGQQLLFNLPVYIILGGFIALFVLIVASNIGNIGSGQQITIMFLFGMIIMLCVVAIYVMIVSAISTFSRRNSVFENVGAITGIKQGFNFMIKNFGDVLVFWVISWIPGVAIGIFNTAFGFGFAMVLIAVGVPLMFISPIIAVLALLGIILLAVIFVSLIQGPIYAFDQMYWTNAYLAIKQKKVN